MKNLSVLRWAGSKAKLIPDLAAIAPTKYNRYIEPFAGSACLLFSLQPNRAILGDINPEVINLYEAIKVDPEGVFIDLTSIPRTPEAYYQLRAIRPNQITTTQRAARLIFLMKACFNGVYRTNRKGEFNVPMGDRVYALPSLEDISRVHAQLLRTELVLGDFSKTIQQSSPGDWIYMDPPYRSSGRYRGEYGYAADFRKEELALLIASAKRLAAQGTSITISYSHDDALIDALPGWTVHRVSAYRTVAGNATVRGRAAELILTNYKQ